MTETTTGVSVRIPNSLRDLSARTTSVDVDGSTISEVLDSLETAHPGFKERLLDDEGDIRRLINIHVNDDDVRFLQGLETSVPPGATVHIVSVANI